MKGLKKTSNKLDGSQIRVDGKRFQLLSIVVTGSQLYGTATADSDIDLKGVYAETLEGKLKLTSQAVGGKSMDEKGKASKLFRGINKATCDFVNNLDCGVTITEGDDCDMTELTKFVSTVIKNNPTNLDIISAPTQFVVWEFPEFTKIKSNLLKYGLSKKGTYTYLGYAMQQFSKIKLHRQWVLDYKEIEHVISLISSMMKIRSFTDKGLNRLESIYGGKITKYIKSKDSVIIHTDYNNLSEIPNIEKYQRPHQANYFKPLKSSIINDEDFDLIFEPNLTLTRLHNNVWKVWKLVGTEPTKGIWDSANVLHKSLKRPVQDNGDYEVGIVVFNERQYGEDVRLWNALWSWRCNRNPKRLALEIKYGYDTKFAYHMIRLGVTGLHFAKTGVVQPQLDATTLALINKIRTGKVKYNWIESYMKKLNAEFVAARKLNTLPHESNIRELNQLVINLYRLIENEY